VKIYTRTGDDGTTGLFGGGRVKKTAARVEAYGTVDELNAVIGLVRASGMKSGAVEDPWLDTLLASIQTDLFVLGAELATMPGKEDKLRMRLLDQGDASRLETAIDEAERELEPLKYFILPGGYPLAAHMHHARVVCRRAERAVLAIDEEPARNELVVFLNRLSDLLFVLARRSNQRAGVADVPWVPKKDGAAP
jgi:cob(I)alamin adenosyltransferase